jgi:hypothetical protein
MYRSAAAAAARLLLLACKKDLNGSDVNQSFSCLPRPHGFPDDSSSRRHAPEVIDELWYYDTCRLSSIYRFIT